MKLKFGDIDDLYSNKLDVFASLSKNGGYPVVQFVVNVWRKEYKVRTVNLFGEDWKILYCGFDFNKASGVFSKNTL